MKWPWRRDIGWTEIGEEFTRWTLLWTPWFTIYLHRLWCPNEHPQCHDHPWSFLSFILWGGYWEYNGGLKGWQWVGPGAVLYRPATWSHNVVTDRRVSWSLVFTGPKKREWSLHECR